LGAPETPAPVGETACKADSNRKKIVARRTCTAGILLCRDFRGRCIAR
jgi:hypothetical protein